MQKYKLKAQNGKVIANITCCNCGYEWWPRTPEVRICPKCKSSRFDIPKDKP